MSNPVQDEDEDPMDKMNEDEEADGPSGDIDPKVLAKKGIHIEGEDEVVDPDAPAEPLLPDLALLGDDDMPVHEEEDENEIDVDEEFGDKDEQW